MIIQSCDERCYIEIKPTSERYGICRVTAGINLDQGAFIAENKSLPLLKLADFIIDFQSFILNKVPRIRLEGGYDSFLSFVSEAGSVFVEFSVGNGFCGYMTYAPFNLTGRFQVEIDQLESILSDFKSLAAAAH